MAGPSAAAKTANIAANKPEPRPPIAGPQAPAENPGTPEKIALGHRLFMERGLSVDGSRSCYSCHQNELGNADGRPTALAAGGKVLARNTPTIWNVAYHQALYWDGRAPSLEAQALGAWKAAMGVGAEAQDAKAAEIAAKPEYAADFEKAFGVKPAGVDRNHVAQAIASYERTLLCNDTRFDKGELTDAEQRGWALFRGKGACITCHAGEQFTDGAFHNVGLERAPDGEQDIGRGKITKDATDNGKFRTPTLRNVQKTAPYFHDGREPDLAAAVRRMASAPPAGVGGADPLMTDKGLSDAEIADVVAFLGALTCPGTLEVLGDQHVEGISAAK